MKNVAQDLSVGFNACGSILEISFPLCVSIHPLHTITLYTLADLSMDSCEAPSRHRALVETEDGKRL